MLAFLALLAATVSAGSPPKVNVTLYSESLCPDCQHYILTGWDAMWKAPKVGGPDGFINFHQVVWGNARLSPSGAITCQHGPTECEMNIVQDCAIALSTGPEQWIPFIVCLEESGTSQKKSVSKCAASVKLSINALNTCSTGPQGQALIMAAYNATPTDHQYVPWTTVNGVNQCDENGCDGVLAAACKAYVASGGVAPAACPAMDSPVKAKASNLRKEATACKKDW